MEERIEDWETIETGYSPPSEKEARWLFDYTMFLLQLRAKLLGGYLIEDPQKGMVIKVPKGSKPFMNVEGVEDTIAIVNGFVEGKIQGLTILDEERVLTWCRELHRKLALLYYLNMEKYELKPAKASLVIRMVCNLFESNFRKSIGGMSLRLIGQTERIVTHKTESKGLLRRII